MTDSPPPVASQHHPISFLRHLDVFVKLGTGFVGVLYVFGLLISSIQFMAIGIPNVSALQTRNIMTGVLFLLFVIAFIATLAPLLVSLLACKSRLPQLRRSPIATPLRCLAILCGGLIQSLLIAELVGTLFGYIYPWGRRWEEMNVFSHTAWTWHFMSSDAVRCMLQFLDTYNHAKILTGGAAIVFSTLYYPRVVNLVRSADVKPILQRLVILSIVMTACGEMALLLVGFSEDVYPNVRFNLGGGQPQIAELRIVGPRSVLSALPVNTICCGDSAHDYVVTTDPVAIWYQSNDFLFTSPLPRTGQGPTRIVAVDLHMMRMIRYVPNYVRIGSGGVIMAVRPY